MNPLPDPKFTRRAFLKSSALAAAGLAAGSDAASPGWIDAHVHVWTPDLRLYPLAEGRSPEDMKPPSFTAAELLAECRPQGVERVVLIQMSFYRYDNSYMIDVMREHPGVFGGVAVIDETARGALGVMRALAAQGVRGFRLHTGPDHAAGWSGSAAMRRMWESGADEGLAMCCLARPESLPAISAMCEDFPRTPVVIDHFARIGASGAIEESELSNLLRLAERPQVKVKVSAFYALGAKAPPYDDLAPMIRRLRDAAGASSLMWATDCPYQLREPHTYEASLALVRDRLDFLDAEEKQWILRRTAEETFFS